MPDDLPILLDGAGADGGGLTLRTALALSLVTGRPFGLLRVRAGRPEPGLRPAHVAAIRAAAGLCDAEVSGDAPGSPRLEFRPRRAVRPAEGLVLEAGPGGSATLLLQALCWPLALAGGASTLTLRGGTHQPLAPSFHFLALAWAAAAARLGFAVELTLQTAAFHADGGGELAARIAPARALPALDLGHRGLLREVEVVSMTGGRSAGAADRQATRAARALRALGLPAEVERLPLPVQGSQGGHVLVLASFERLRTGHGAVAPPDRPPEEAADLAVAAFRDHLTAGGALDPLLADQLLVPAALRAAGLVPAPAGPPPSTRFTVSQLTPHLLAAAAVLQRFLDVEVALVGRPGEPGEVRVQPPGGAGGLLPLPRG
ncbi:MAG: RNA 3'-phosphate cyclase [Anaeromyxobacter sp.]|nr:RNA 3'-phosphate cyclase [Anaeromyxobacter sp.]MBL0277930.1 RNA 3'-phosphate cyclase [Anaeromyxobacter sp.]